LAPAAVTATEHESDPVYLSLGTSLAAGVMADANGDSTFSSRAAYSDQLYRRMRDRIDEDLQHVKLGCSGETADQFVGGTNVYGEASKCAALYATGTQLGDALATLATENVVLVTIDLGANDINQAQDVCSTEPDPTACIVASIGPIATKVANIVGALRVVGGYTGPIIGMNYYNPQVAAAIGFFAGAPGPLEPNPTLAVLTDQLAQGFNGALQQAYTATGAHTADVYTAFNAGDFGDDKPENGIPDNVDRVCRLTYMCPDDEGANANIHPNKRGYRVMAKTFFKIVKTIEFA
jgi:lysophospholipase L1-like esterase